MREKFPELGPLDAVLLVDKERFRVRPLLPSYAWFVTKDGSDWECSVCGEVMRSGENHECWGERNPR